MIYICDLEVFPNFFLAGFVEKNTNSTCLFEISEWKDDSEELHKFLLQEGLMLVGYNNIGYDYPIIHYVLESELLELGAFEDAMYITNAIYNHSQTIIDDEWSSIQEWKTKIPQLDLMRVHHLDNKHKSATLKDIEFIMRYPNVEDLVISPHTQLFKGVHDDDRKKVIDYNINDLMATKMFYERSKKEIKLRSNLSKKYNLKLTNANDPKMGAEIFAAKLAPRLGLYPWELKKMQTNRSMVTLDECIFPYINFKTHLLQDLLERTKKIHVYEGSTKGVWEDEVIFGNVKYKVGLGGIHGCIKSGIYQEDEDHIILSSDVVSYYPNLSIKNRFYPAHLTEIYCDVYEDIFNERKLYPKGTPENYGLKIALNGSFGKSNEQYSFFKDLKYFLRTTLNGQMLILMLCERVAHLGQILMANTDGIEILIHKDKKQEYLDICAKWETFTRLELEHAQYRKMIIRDVNNYRAVVLNEEDIDEDKVYEKGCFEIDKMLHKDHSMLIVPKALKAYYVDGIPIKKFIHSHTDIFDFYIRLKIRSNFSAEIRYVVGENINEISLTKTTRYYASTSGGYIFRSKDDLGSVTAIKKNQRCIIANKHIEKDISEYNIDYQFYERECSKVINAVDKGQLNLFQ